MKPVNFLGLMNITTHYILSNDAQSPGIGCALFACLFARSYLCSKRDLKTGRVREYVVRKNIYEDAEDMIWLLLEKPVVA